ncbi:ABC transporter substrate-binding protein [Pseudooceanicola nanhaiensis]|uniref:ABC transporter substrate-binding protein n=1 Tax=Pseudooceanicola nanhaiensis TaxID=375761 RepID=UPI001CD39D6A|nr:ABC transporter substrate-binding protein [Pseudooceanicola nanhaiensis]MCA0920816.1 ABC transporter substrate-binding protein [Pseudooceanicola nanhaiensis]
MTEMKPKGWRSTDDLMVESALRRGATRRDLLRMFAASGLALSAAGSLAASASRAFAETPQTGGALRVAIGSTSTGDTLDPARARQQADYLRLTTFYNKLVSLDFNLAPRMELAESLESDDAKTWVIKVREGVTFHDGKALTADDVVYSLNRHIDPAVGSQANALAAQMTSITKTGPMEVTIELEAGNADLPAVLATYHFCIIADGTTDFTTANGTGPYICEVFEPGIRSVAVKNPNYWREGGYLDSIELFGIEDRGARANALISGDVQLIGSMDQRSARLIEAEDSLKLMITPGGSYSNLNIRLDEEPGVQFDFVQGMKHLINREVINRAVLRGYGDLHNDQPVQRANHYFNEEVVAPEFDPEKAKFHFEKAGMAGAKIPVIASEAAKYSVDMSTIIQQDAQKAGITLDVQRVPRDGYWSTYWLKAPIHWGNINARPTADILFSLLYTSDAKWNESKFYNESFDKMAAEARVELDEAKRKEIYGSMQRMIAEKAGTIIPAYLSSVDAMSDKVMGIQPHPLGLLQGYDFAETVWLKA